jgi:hypothetical protein
MYVCWICGGGGADGAVLGFVVFRFFLRGFKPS